MPLSWGMGDQDSRRALAKSPCLTPWLFCRRRGQAPHVPHPATPSAGLSRCPSGLPLPAPPRPTHLRTLWPGWEETCKKPLHKVSLVNDLSEAPGDWIIVISCGYWLNILELLSCVQWNKAKQKISVTTAFCHWKSTLSAIKLCCQSKQVSRNWTMMPINGVWSKKEFWCKMVRAAITALFTTKIAIDLSRHCQCVWF